MIDETGWLDWTTKAPGPHDKVYSQRNSIEGFACHSMVGYYPGALSRLLSQQRTEDGRYTAYAAASWHFSIRYTGEVMQHYSVWESCWTTGSRKANTMTVASELEGGFNPTTEPMTEAQARSWVRIIKDLEAYRDFPFVVGANIRQHKEWVALYGGNATACASDRYQKGYDLLEEDDMTDEELKAALKRIGYADDVGAIDVSLRAAEIARWSAVNKASDPNNVPKEG